MAQDPFREVQRAGAPDRPQLQLPVLPLNLRRRHPQIADRHRRQDEDRHSFLLAIHQGEVDVT